MSDKIEFYVESNLGRLVRIVVIDRKAKVSDVLLYGERVAFGSIHDAFAEKVKGRDKKKT